MIARGLWLCLLAWPAFGLAEPTATTAWVSWVKAPSGSAAPLAWALVTALTAASRAADSSADFPNPP